MAREREYNIIKPLYYDEFSCIGGACEDNCCYGWSIVLDKKTYTRYRNVKSPVFAEKHDRYIRRIKGKTASDLNYAKFELTAEGLCPFQTKDGLCEIHRDLGEEYLCRTCQLYPRTAKGMRSDFAELSVSMSCPEAVRVALFDEGGIEFVAERKSYRDDNPLLLGGKLPEMGEKETNYLQYGWEMREAAITIMQIRTCPVAYRLIIIAMMLDDVVRLHDEGKHEEIPGILEYYGTGTYGEAFIEGLSGLDTNDALQTKISMLLYLTFKERTGQPRSSAFDEIIERVRQYCETAREDSSKDDGVMAVEFHFYVKEKMQAHWDEFLEKWEYVLENYLVSYMFSELFPLRFHEKGINPYHHTLFLAEQYTMLKMLLCGNYDEAEGFSKEYLTRIITQIAVLNQHSTFPLKTVSNYRDIGIDTPAHLYYFLF